MLIKSNRRLAKSKHSASISYHESVPYTQALAAAEEAATRNAFQRKNSEMINSLTNGHSYSSKTELEKAEILNQYPSTKNILMRARSEMKSITDFSTIPKSGNLKSLNIQNDYVKNIETSFKNINCHIDRFGKTMSTQVWLERR